MGAITIRKLDDDVLNRMKRRAKAAGRSMEEEARRSLTRAFAAKPTIEEWLADARETRERLFGERVFPDDFASDTIREVRDEVRGLPNTDQ